MTVLPREWLFLQAPTTSFYSPNTSCFDSGHNTNWDTHTIHNLAHPLSLQKPAPEAEESWISHSNLVMEADEPGSIGE